MRPARLDDERALLPIHLATWTADVSPGPNPNPSQPLLNGQSIADVLVAEEEDRVVGYVRLNQPGPLPSHAHVLVIDGLAVDPARQGSGIGRTLIEAAVQEARRRGVRKVTLRVLAPNVRARTLYESCGFSVEGVLRREFWLNQQFVDDVFMARYLDDAGV